MRLFAMRLFEMRLFCAWLVGRWRYAFLLGARCSSKSMATF